jgi:hypothetical protein
MIIEPGNTTGEVEVDFDRKVLEETNPGATDEDIDALAAERSDARASAGPEPVIGDPVSPPGVSPDEPDEPWTMDDERPLDT